MSPLDSPFHAAPHAAGLAEGAELGCRRSLRLGPQSQRQQALQEGPPDPQPWPLRLDGRGACRGSGGHAVLTRSPWPGCKRPAWGWSRMWDVLGPGTSP